MKKFLYLFFLLTLILAGFFGWHRWLKVTINPVSREFYSLVYEAKQEYLDLRLLNTPDWDELVYWSPYKNICDYNILDINQEVQIVYIQKMMENLTYCY